MSVGESVDEWQDSRCRPTTSCMKQGHAALRCAPGMQECNLRHAVLGRTRTKQTACAAHVGDRQMGRDGQPRQGGVTLSIATCLS